MALGDRSGLLNHSCSWSEGFVSTVGSVVIAINIDNFVFLLRDRKGEDTHQNVVHDTVLSFGRVTYVTLLVLNFTYCVLVSSVQVKLALFPNPLSDTH